MIEWINTKSCEEEQRKWTCNHRQQCDDLKANRRAKATAFFFFSARFLLIPFNKHKTIHASFFPVGSPLGTAKSFGAHFHS